MTVRTREYAFIVCLCLMLVGCKQQLTRGQAEALIRAKQNYPVSESDTIDLSWDDHCFNMHVSPCTASAEPAEAKSLEQLRLIEVRFDGPTSRISLTHNAQEYVAGDVEQGHGGDGSRVTRTLRRQVVVARRQFGNVVGIRELPQLNQCVVEFTEITVPTPFGINRVPSFYEARQSVSIKKEAVMQRYDDGWRLLSIQ